MREAAVSIYHFGLGQSGYFQASKADLMIAYLEYAQVEIEEIDKHAEVLLIAAIKRLKSLNRKASPARGIKKHDTVD